MLFRSRRASITAALFHKRRKDRRQEKSRASSISGDDFAAAAVTFNLEPEIAEPGTEKISNNFPQSFGLHLNPTCMKALIETDLQGHDLVRASSKQLHQASSSISCATVISKDWSSFEDPNTVHWQYETTPL